ncbi:glyoxylate/hydroxypyruvate reductase A [Zobellia amurskyensis]|uniref:Glyoxylate/hydroxypyruvate reductase A n=1 Tax=Zobellia amurskyensis TaxID=248905 RepID=A0A7X3D2P4_9FLAO|nr:glyoxylate/hydroxypyruvate reductase A [Zobellia amurskyensis]MUH36798.1 glyoxylate/hydroxypyruvate reductase A [Zobellia amurskyensis]
MAIVIIRQDDKIELWKKALLAQQPDLEVYSYLEEHPKERIKMALVWKHPEGALANYPNLKLIASSGAGVDFIFEDETAPKNLPITRVVDDMLAKDMSEHVLAVILSHLKNLDRYRVNQTKGIWKPIQYRRISDFTVGIMGLGALGRELASDLVKYDFKVQGWANSKKEIEGVKCFVGESGFQGFLETTQILVCLLPLTDATSGILNKNLFKQLPNGAFVINVARGGHLVDEDLLEMLNNGYLSGAGLDVYHQEPLPKEHPFWSHEKIQMTPHYASVSDTNSVVPQILENYDRLLNGSSLLNEVMMDKGY